MLNYKYKQYDIFINNTKIDRFKDKLKTKNQLN